RASMSSARFSRTSRRFIAEVRDHSPAANVGRALAAATSASEASARWGGEITSAGAGFVVAFVCREVSSTRLQSISGRPAKAGAVAAAGHWAKVLGRAVVAAGVAVMNGLLRKQGW